MKLIALALTGLVSLAASASIFTDVKKDEPLCFQQNYSVDHMLKHIQQTVKSMKVKVYRGTEEGDEANLYLAIETDLLQKNKKDTKPYHTGMVCMTDEKSGRLNCSIECDGGRAKLRASTTTGDVLRFQNEGFVLYGGCDGDNDEDTVFLKPTKNGDDMFLLNKMTDAKACAAIKGW